MKGGESELRVIDEWDGGRGWLAHPDEGTQRASHAVVVDSAERSSAGSRTQSGDVDGDVWTFDPVDAPGVDELLTDLGTVAGVVVCLDRHKRDAAAIARRHDAPVYVPDWMTGVATKLDARVERFGRELADTGFRAVTVKNGSIPPWQEAALFDEARGTLYVPEAVGTAPYFRADGERLGVHPMLRLSPPRRALSGLDPERILVGHGTGVDADAAAALRDALADARKNAPSAYLNALLGMF